MNRSFPLMQSSWQTELAESFTRVSDLLSFLELDPAALPPTAAAAELFPFRVTRAYAQRIEKRHIDDPLLRQVLPLPAECLDAEGFSADPVGDLAALTQPGLLHKYQGRVLLITTGACAIHCRYCFRREFPYQSQQLARSREETALEAIARDDAIHEVILSGGDPLVLSNDRLGELVRSVAAIPHVRRLRFHTRLPVVLPSRVDTDCLAWLRATRLRLVMVIHANHAREIDHDVKNALLALRDAGVTLLNQAVLLRGVNDDAESLARLSEQLFDAQVLPYYLHLLDRARGTAHFEVDEGRALVLMRELQRRLPGYLVPRLVRETAGAAHKLAVY